MGGLAVFISLVMMFMWLGPVYRRRAVGLGMFTDISVHLVLQFLLGGASDGRMALLFGGVLFNLFLMTYRKLRGYASLENGEWVTHSGWFYRAAKQRPTGSSSSTG